MDFTIQLIVAAISSEEPEAYRRAVYSRTKVLELLRKDEVIWR